MPQSKKKHSPYAGYCAALSATKAASVSESAADSMPLQKHPRRCTRRLGVVVEHGHRAVGEAHSALCVSLSLFVVGPRGPTQSTRAALLAVVLLQTHESTRAALLVVVLRYRESPSRDDVICLNRRLWA